jgi:hypothetical protein
MEDFIINIIEQARIVSTLNALFIGTDNQDWERVKECFADEVLFDMTSMGGGEPRKLTPGQITDRWAQGLKGLRAIHHQAGNYQVSVKGNNADAFCYGIAYHYLPNPTNNNTRVFVGSYDFHLIKKDASWKVDKFKFNLKFIDGNKDLL